MKFLIDAMLPPSIADFLTQAGHDSLSALALGDDEIPDVELIELAKVEDRVIVTENAKDFAHITSCPVVILRKRWWSRHTMPRDIASAIQRWANANPEPDHSAVWLDARFR